jgi:hypothetical protein
VISAPVLQRLQEQIAKFHKLREVFIDLGVRVSISLPRQHALSHYVRLIMLFGAPNGLCSSITESKHIKAVKEPWRRSNRFKALGQMLICIIRMEKMAALRRSFSQHGMLNGTVSSHVAVVDVDYDEDGTGSPSDSESEDSDVDLVNHPGRKQCYSSNDEVLPADGERSMVLKNKVSDVRLAARIRMFFLHLLFSTYCGILQADNVDHRATISTLLGTARRTHQPAVRIIKPRPFGPIRGYLNKYSLRLPIVY